MNSVSDVGFGGSGEALADSVKIILLNNIIILIIQNNIIKINVELVWRDILSSHLAVTRHRL